MDRFETWFMYSCGLWHVHGGFNNFLRGVVDLQFQLECAQRVIFAITFSRVKF